MELLAEKALWSGFKCVQKTENHRTSEASWKDLCLRSKWDPEPAGAVTRHPAASHLDARRNVPRSLCGVEQSLAKASSSSLALTSLLWPTACSTFDLLWFPTLTSGWAAVAMTTSPWFWLSLASGHSFCTHSQLGAQFLVVDLSANLFAHFLQAPLDSLIGIWGLDPSSQKWACKRTYQLYYWVPLGSVVSTSLCSGAFEPALHYSPLVGKISLP